MVLDTICFLETRNMHNLRWMDKEQIKAIEYINSVLPKEFGDDCLGMSTLSLIISAYTDNHLENLTLDDMINIFQKVEHLEETVKNRINNGFMASYTYPMLKWLKDGWSIKYIEKINMLKQICFEEIYEERVLPRVKVEIAKKQDEIKGINFSGLFDNVSKMKNTAINDVKMFFSFFSYPVAFTLYNGSFLTCFTEKGQIDFIALTAHELMHGFASTELTELYRDYINIDDFLTHNHEKLINEFRSGDEEEFVMAAEYYLCLQTGLYDKNELMRYAKAKYNGCTPVAAILFYLLQKEKDVPTDYNKWLIDIFESDKLPKTNIKEFVDSL